jgi:hypothetical protein
LADAAALRAGVESAIVELRPKVRGGAVPTEKGLLISEWFWSGLTEPEKEFAMSWLVRWR